MKPYLPGSFEDTLQNLAEKINFKYKAWEFLMYIFVLGLAVFQEVLPELYYRNSCKLVAGVHIILQQSISSEQISFAHTLLINFMFEFEKIYYQCDISRVHFVR